MRQSRARSRRGFTLLELTLVILIMAVFAAIAIPKFADSSARYRLDAAEARVRADVEMALKRARATGVTHRIQFDETIETYAIYTGAGPSAVIVSIQNISDRPYQADLVSVTVSDATRTMEIDGYGEAVNGVTIVLAVGSATRTLYLSVEPPAVVAAPADTGKDTAIDAGGLPVDLDVVGR